MSAATQAALVALWRKRADELNDAARQTPEIVSAFTVLRNCARELEKALIAGG
jgi:hypothetical protein